MNDQRKRFTAVRWLLLLGALLVANVVAAGLGARNVRADEAPCLISGSNCRCNSFEGTSGGQCLSTGETGSTCTKQCKCKGTCEE